MKYKSWQRMERPLKKKKKDTKIMPSYSVSQGTMYR